MKWKIEQKYIRVGMIALVVIIVSILFQHMLENENGFQEFIEVANGTLGPIVVGCIMAYLLNPVLDFFERVLYKPMARVIFRNREDKQHKLSRGLSVASTLILFLFLLIGGLYLVIPQVSLSLQKIVYDAPSYYKTVSKWVDALDKDQSEVSKYLMILLDQVYSRGLAYLNDSILPNMDKIVAGITSGIVLGLKMILNIVLSIIISVYVMSEKETLVSVGKKLTYSIFSRKNANAIVRGARYAHQVFGGFINGKIIDSFIIGAICYIFMMFADFDYAVLISIIVGVTNVIPYFGPFIGAIPSILILLMTDFKEGLIFAVFVLILQQVDGNIIGPVILGDRLKISSMWILFAILVGGGFFGVPGMILGAPCFACAYALISTFCKGKLQEKGLPLQTSEYYNIDQACIDGDGIILRESNDNRSQDEKDSTQQTDNQEDDKQN